MGTFHTKMGWIKDRNDMDLTEAEDIKKRWQEYTEELYKKDLHHPDNHDGVNTHLEPDILEFQWSCFKSWKMMLWKGCTQYASNLENSAVATGLGKVSFHCNSKERQCQERSNYHTIALISHASKVMLKILQPRLQQCVNCELPNVQAGFRKGRGTRDQIASIFWIMEKQESSRKISISALLTMPKPLTVWITINCEDF